MSHPELDYSTPVSFTFRQRLSLTLLAPLVALVIRLLFGTCRVEVRNAHYHYDAEKRFGCVLLVFWHEVLPLAAWRYRGTGYHTLTSYSYDGEFVARVISWHGMGALRGSSSRGGGDALNRMKAAIDRRVTLGFTPDGPRGPRREMKSGAAVLGARTGVPVIPTGLAVNRCWRMKSWDKMVIPKPFSLIVCEYGDAIAPCESEDETAIEAKRAEIEVALNEVQRKIERGVGMPE
ncbi:MAG: lysophospholipid acyltransferase family protein [Candidatus Hydrogenedentes bacterium]|nr:lysophospholipid acyltransferase family protein [Candidatus Hydrogenedentota bacterium]